MKNKINILAAFFLILSVSVAHAECMTGAFLGDAPGEEDIINFQKAYGKKPYLVMLFVSWQQFIDKKIINDVYKQDCALLITWEPWDPVQKQGIDYNGLVKGKYDDYITKFADRLKTIKGNIYIRFAHEMNGNWYPWAGVKIGKDTYITIYRHIKDVFDKAGVKNIKWIFSINWEDIPKENNSFALYYPGDGYVDYIGIDGYNWGTTQAWSRWITFGEMFENRYNETTEKYKKPVLITEFSSVSKGGDKLLWIKDAMTDIKRMDNINGFVLFNVNKEVNWSFPADEPAGREFKKQIQDKRFKASK